MLEHNPARTVVDMANDDLSLAVFTWAAPTATPSLYSLPYDDLAGFTLDLEQIAMLAELPPARPDLIARADDLQESIPALAELRYEHGNASREERRELRCVEKFSQTQMKLAKLYADLSCRANAQLEDESRSLDTTQADDRETLSAAAQCSELAAQGIPELSSLSLRDLREFDRLLRSYHPAVKRISLLKPSTPQLADRQMRDALRGLDALIEARASAEDTWTKVGAARRAKQLGVSELSTEAQERLSDFYGALGERSGFVLSLA